MTLGRGQSTEPYPTPPGRLADALLRDLGPAWRQLRAIHERRSEATPGAVEAIRRSVERAIARILRDIHDTPDAVDAASDAEGEDEGVEDGGA